ncbi:MAG: TonB-dependent receptor [Pyrinomonadaceae bacterium]|nr:TonB-dependent receptor [Pyrinomonadaceae bacterium]
MFRATLIVAVILTAQIAFGQESNTLRLNVINKDTKAPVAEATITIKNTELNTVTNAAGMATIANVPDGEYVIQIFSPGFAIVEIKIAISGAKTSEKTIELEIDNDVGDVTISSTRTGREIDAEPTRVEAIDEEEIDEKINMRPANISMLLNESTGIRVQQTSATSNAQSVRIQGLDGRYTQILKDGFPSFGGFSGSFSILEIPPLDLKQVEVIKGPSGTLFGQGAIAGVVNLISKTPDYKRVTTLLFNQTSALGSDVSAFSSARKGRLGYTALGSFNYQREYDVDNDDFTELPRTFSVAFNPRLFAYIGKDTTFSIANATSFQKRTGGDILAFDGNANGIHQYFEKNGSFRNITTINFDTLFADGSRLVAKQSLAFFSRDIETPSTAFKGRQFNAFSDVAYFRSFGKNSFIIGGNIVFDRFNESNVAVGSFNRSETRSTIGVFAQNTVDISKKLSLEAGIRVDNVRDYGSFVLPRASLLYRFTDKFTTRIGYGLGYKLPSVFTEDAEELLFRDVAGIGNSLRAERSQGGTFDLNYSDLIIENVGFSLNQMFFYTQIDEPLILRADGMGIYRFANSQTPVISKGFETNAKITVGIAKLFVGYTYTDAKAGYLAGDRHLTLLPKHKINSSLVFEEHENFKAGAEFYFADRQILDDRSLTPQNAVFGLFGEKTFGKMSLFINAENIFDNRQGRNSPVVLGNHASPDFAKIYTHVEGRVFNGGIKLRF